MTCTNGLAWQWWPACCWPWVCRWCKVRSKNEGVVVAVVARTVPSYGSRVEELEGLALANGEAKRGAKKRKRGAKRGEVTSRVLTG